MDKAIDEKYAADLVTERAAKKASDDTYNEAVAAAKISNAKIDTDYDA